MPTRSRKTFSIRETYAPMNSSIKDTLDAILTRMNQMNQLLQEYRDQDDANSHDLIGYKKSKNPKLFREKQVPS